MQCMQFEERFHAILDQRQRPQDDNALLAHAAACADCQTLLDGEETLFLALDARRRTEQPAAAMGIPENARMTTANTGTGQRFRGSPYRPAALVALAASIVVVAFLLRLDPMQTPTAARLDLETAQTAFLADVDQLRPADATNDSLAETQNDLSAVLDRWAVLASSELTAQLEYGPAASSLLQFTGRFRPLADPFVVLFDVLRRSFGWQALMPPRPDAT